jgi:antirestriction protein ArdC
MNSQQIRESVNEQLLQAMSKNILPWRQPWSSNRSGRHRNFQTQRPYSGCNPMLLELHCLRHGLGSNQWATFRQWEALGCMVKKRPANVPAGSWGCNVILCKPIKKTVLDRETGEEKDKSYMILRSFTVFNADQVTGEAVERLRKTQIITGPDYPTAQELLDKSGARIIHNSGDKAFYVRPIPEGLWPNHQDGDYIVLPERATFHTQEAYYETAFHELSHHSEIRLGWDHRQEGYEKGELRAEITACYVASELGLPLVSVQNHGAYLQHWLQAMKESPSFIFSVCAAASRATDHLLSAIRPTEAESEESEESTLVGAA